MAGQLRGAAAFKGPLQEDPLFPGATESRPEVGVQEGGADEGVQITGSRGKLHLGLGHCRLVCFSAPEEPVPSAQDKVCQNKNQGGALILISNMSKDQLFGYCNLLIMQSWCINVQVTKIIHIGAGEIT